MRIGLLTTDWSRTLRDSSGRPALGGSGHIRFAQYIPYLEGEFTLGAPVFDSDKGIFGAHILMHPEQFRNEDDLSDIIEEERDIVWDLDVVVIQRILDGGMADAVARARSNGQKVFQEIDDHMWAIPTWNRAFEGTHPDLHPTKNVYHYAESILESDGVMTSTPELRDVMLDKFRLPTALVENHVEVEKFLIPRVPNDPPRVGWTGATGWKSGDLETLKPFAKMFPWVHGGASSYDGDFEQMTGATDVIEHPLMIAENYPKMFTFDVGVVPLQQNLFNDCKSWIKGIEYAAAGIPFVASPTREYVRLQEEHGIGYIAHKTKNWISTLKLMLNDAEYRAEESIANRRSVLALDVRIGAKRFESAIEALIGAT